MFMEYFFEWVCLGTLLILCLAVLVIALVRIRRLADPQEPAPPHERKYRRPVVGLTSIVTATILLLIFLGAGPYGFLIAGPACVLVLLFRMFYRATEPRRYRDDETRFRA